jgi:hypothetical protein
MKEDRTQGPTTQAAQTHFLCHYEMSPFVFSFLSLVPNPEQSLPTAPIWYQGCPEVQTLGYLVGDI